MFSTVCEATELLCQVSNTLVGGKINVKFSTTAKKKKMTLCRKTNANRSVEVVYLRWKKFLDLRYMSPIG